MSENSKKNKTGAIGSAFRAMIFVVIAGLLCVGAYFLGRNDTGDGDIIGSEVVSQSETEKISFSDIGELATQEVRCTEVNVTDASRELFGIKIPFTQSKYVYSYDVIIKAGFDFAAIDYNVSGSLIEVFMPEPEIMSRELDTDSFKLYHEKESIFKRITLTDNNEALGKLIENAETSAINGGLFENAKSNAELILKGFFANEYDMERYAIVFTYISEDQNTGTNVNNISGGNTPTNTGGTNEDGNKEAE